MQQRKKGTAEIYTLKQLKRYESIEDALRANIPNYFPQEEPQEGRTLEEVEDAALFMLMYDRYSEKGMRKAHGERAYNSLITSLENIFGFRLIKRIKKEAAQRYSELLAQVRDGEKKEKANLLPPRRHGGVKVNILPID